MTRISAETGNVIYLYVIWIGLLLSVTGTIQASPC